jgi:hypothetical protein
LLDLGFSVEAASRIKAEIFNLTSGMPHLIQGYGDLLVDLAIRRNTDTISFDDVNSVREDYLTFIYALGPLQDLSDNLSRLVALLLIKRDLRDITVHLVTDLLQAEGFHVDTAKATEICNDLVICNVLIWKNAGYRVANLDIARHARNVGIVEPELHRIREILGRATARSQML